MAYTLWHCTHHRLLQMQEEGRVRGALFARTLSRSQWDRLLRSAGRDGLRVDPGGLCSPQSGAEQLGSDSALCCLLQLPYRKACSDITHLRAGATSPHQHKHPLL